MSERKIGFDRATLGDKIAEETDARARQRWIQSLHEVLNAPHETRRSKPHSR